MLSRHQSNSSEINLNYKWCERDHSMFISDFKYLLKIYYIHLQSEQKFPFTEWGLKCWAAATFLWHSASVSLFHQSHLLPPLASMFSSLPPVMPADQSPQGRQFLKPGIFLNRKVNKRPPSNSKQTKNS